MQAELCTTQPY